LRTQTNLVALRRPKQDKSANHAAHDTLGRLLDELPDIDVDVHETAVINIEAARVRRFVRRLPVLERKVIAARYGLAGNPMSCRQLATRLGISKSTVSDIEQRALDRLRGMYELPDAA